MEMNELKQMIDERSQKQIEAAKESIKKELGAVPQAQIDEAVSKAVAEITEKAKKDEAENVKYLEAFKEAVSGGDSIKVKETPVTIVNQMIASAASAMGKKDAHNIMQLTQKQSLSRQRKTSHIQRACTRFWSRKLLTPAHLLRVVSLFLSLSAVSTSMPL
jgi:hypothetical protein